LHTNWRNGDESQREYNTHYASEDVTTEILTNIFSNSEIEREKLRDPITKWRNYRVNESN
jgi:hypothetical protein